MRVNLSLIEEYVASHLRLFIVSVAGLLVFVGIIAISVFFIALRGAEQTMVPDVTGKELTQALLELQVKELYPRLQLRYSQSSRDKGNILEQEPKSGTIVRAGRRIRLVVSQGVVVNKVENFVTRNIEEVRVDLLTLQTASGSPPLLTIKEPLMYEFSSEPPGTILAQKPEYLADIFGPLALEFVVSKGRENITVVVPQFTGVQFTRALELISGTGINYHFTARAKTGDETAETVVFQNPGANTAIPVNNVVQLIVTYPDRIADNERFGIFSYPIPQNPYPLAVRLDAQLPSGERQRLLAVNYMGGNFTVPYKLPVGSILILSMMNRELYRATIGN